MYTAAQLSEIINSKISEIKYPDSPAGLYAPIKYTLDGGGKRLRPMLVLASCAALGQSIDKSINQALGIEIFHNFTLLHDDVMDNADTRRGKPTVHRHWNVPTAILSGDAMLTMATQYVANTDDPKLKSEAIALFNKTAMEIYEGQQYDMDFESRTDVTVDEYINMIRLKTSVLIGCACEMGALMAGASSDTRKSFYSYGEKLGLAFQLQDDYLDTYGNPEKFGKQIGGDILNDKKTWLLISALELDKTGEAHGLIGSKILPEMKISRMRAIYNRLNLSEECHRLIEKYVNEAVAIVERIGINENAISFFTDLARKSATRDY